MTQNRRLLEFLAWNNHASTLEVIRATNILNLTGRVSELRAKGIDIDCRQEGTIFYYSLMEPLETALDKLGGRKGKVGPPMHSTGPSCPSTGLIRGKRRAKIAGRYVSEGVKKELAQKKQGELL